jgi:2-dehydro-3-deoxyglucarate aldolase/4-hydroxy-2-oxoheptanedioate aldolase
MTLPQNAFKRGLFEGRAMNGTWFMSASPVLAEALGHAGFDFLVLDMEHTIADVPQLFGLLQAVAGTAAASVVRLPWNDPITVKRVMDAGAQSLMFPYIQSVAEAKAAIARRAIRRRARAGVAAMHRASRVGSAPDYLKRAGDEICVVLQLETPEAIALIPEIAGLDGLDCLFVGPGDLSASLGLIGELGHPDVQRALERRRRPCARSASRSASSRRRLRWPSASSATATPGRRRLRSWLVTGRGRDVLAAMKAGP